ncbi:MAG: Gfo/Idh/MocA family oxidoreductase [Phycisphaerae bacterium]
MSTSRRSFIKQMAGAGVALAASRVSAAQQSQPAAGSQPTSKRSPYSDVRLAYIGVGGIGGHHIETTTEHGVQCPCYCEVDTKRTENVMKAFPNARGYQDYRQMFDKEAKNLDAVMIGIPDHQHYPATILAMQLGKHVYTQKPLTHTVWEARQLAEAAKRYKVATQMGNQGHALEGWRLVYEWINGGSLGDITEVHTWTDRPIWPQAVEASEDEDVPPKTLNWDAWLGPAPQRGYRRKAYHPFNWRGYFDFGCGALGDMACHTLDGMFWALDPGAPTSVEPFAGTPATSDSFPKSTIIKWSYPAKGKRPAFVSYWYDGGLSPTTPAALEMGRKLPSTGNLFIGTKATMLVSGDYGESPRIIPETKMKEIGKPAQMLERSPGHQQEWLMACVGEKPLDFPKSNFSYAGPFTEAILLGNLALRMGRKLEWDAAAMKFTNVPEANAFLTKEYRNGWKF